MRYSLNIVTVTMRYFLEIVTVTMSYFLNVVTVTMRYSLNIVTVTMCNLFLKIIVISCLDFHPLEFHYHLISSVWFTCHVSEFHQPATYRRLAN